MKKLLFLLLVLLLGLLGIVWYQQQARRTSLPLSTTAVRVIHRSDNPLLGHKHVQVVHAPLMHRPQQML